MQKAVSGLSATSRYRAAHWVRGDMGNERQETGQGGEIGVNESLEGDASQPDPSGRFRTASVSNSAR